MAGVHPGHVVRALAEGARQGEDGPAGELGAAGHLGRHLAARRLVVQGALGGEHQVGPGEAGVQVEVAQEHVEAGQQPGPDGGESRAETAGRAGAGPRAQVGADDAEVAGEHARPVLQPGRQLLDLRGRRPLLRAEHPGHAPLAAQHVVRVAGDEQLGVLQPGVEAGRVDADEAVQLPSAGSEFEAVPVQQPGPERLERARAPVGRPRVAAADQHAPHPGAESGADSVSPTPYVVVAPGSRRARGTRDRPATAAISTTAVSPVPSSAKWVPTRSPTGPVAASATSRPPVADASATAVPSPPSTSGIRSISASGSTRRTPAAMASAAARADRDSLNPLGATTTWFSTGDG
ncbi:hypothetical protein SLI_2471 [Streptomyces lividans 1326]|uniref:Uncharacterized protein n=1 Tax=Streptomyces lividans 1326 TaxID=1200984 RepID=A0A7U9HBY4_STRLI|nr:hypothetical protein SLI_2471 [Streptomyces lividans 1326]